MSSVPEEATSGAARDAHGPGATNEAVAPDGDPKPRVALIVLCRNEENHIAHCLDTLLENDYDQDRVDIVVVDGMSTDRTREIVAEYCRRHRNVRMVDNPRRITPAAFNVGICSTTAEVVMPISAHSYYPRDYVSRLVAGLYHHEADNIGGVLEPHVEEGTWNEAIGIVCSHPFSAGNARHRTVSAGTQPRRVRTVFCGCYRREVFERIGGFNERLVRGQDREFNERLHESGGKIVLDPSVRCKYVPRAALGAYAAWMFRGGFWVFYAWRFSRTKMRGLRNMIPPFFILWHVLAGAACLAAPPLRAFVLAPIAIYWVVNVLVSSYIAIRRANWLLMPCLVVLFGTTHYTYGAGALAGMVLALVRGRDLES